MTWKYIEYLLPIGWLIAHPGLFILGYLIGSTHYDEKRKGKIDACAKIGSLLTVFFLLGMTVYDQHLVFSGHLEYLSVFLIMGPSCCFFVGLSYGLSRNKLRLWPLVVVIPILMWVLANALICVP